MKLFNVLVLSDRGNHEGAIALLDKIVPHVQRSLSIKLMYIELQVRSGLHDAALAGIDALRQETSSPKNVKRLDTFELQCLLTMGLNHRAEEVYKRIDNRLIKEGTALERVLLKAKLLFGIKKEKAAIELLKEAAKEHPNDTSLLAAFAEYVTNASSQAAPDLLEQAHKAAALSAQNSLFSDPGVLTTLARALMQIGRMTEAQWLIDHALILSPSDRILHMLREGIPNTRCE